MELRAHVEWEYIEHWLKKNVESGGVSAKQGFFVREVANRFFAEQCEEGNKHGYTADR